ncbi:GntR family transcriptional regulator [Amycolatopsis sp. FDAARGOS 1241]|uniref:GntR family transcriptional regulator n=1 Tax=Amycolatopsis sp. FDAARGOS 1241 TaxID=2778070 RepID=UPI00194E1CC0|nr:GntR family transcriptional regulator [Amycolatopsis sp. FDAARGOS 1241]QRP43340.1 GntR family transcriptional regulator [Amycolatopsis sp. FDAARGOS 1241]
MSVNPRPALTKNAYVYEELRRRILAGELVQGQSISQEQLAAELGVSTTPLREALRRLDAEGLVTIDAHRDARVSRLNAEEARSLFEVRERLDPLATKLAAARRTDADIAAIGTALKDLEPLSTSTGFESLLVHRAFHRSIYTASHNPLLMTLLEGLWDKADRYRLIGLQSKPDSPQDQERVRREHIEIAEAVIAGDARTAERAMKKHVQGSLGRRAIAALDA